MKKVLNKVLIFLLADTGDFCMHNRYSFKTWIKVGLTFSGFNPLPSLPSVTTDDRKQFQYLNIVIKNKNGPLFLEFSWDAKNDLAIYYICYI